MSNLVNPETFDLYRHYIAVKQHFNREDYDYFKYNGNVNATVKSMTGRNDKSYFQKINQHRNPKEYVFANILNNPTIWIGDIAQDKDKSDKAFADWERRMQSLTYIFKEEIGQLSDDFDANFIPEEGGHPPLFRLLLRKKVCIETVVILDMILNFTKLWDRKMKNDPVWKQHSIRIRKYKPFLTIELPKFKQMVKDRFLG